MRLPPPNISMRSATVLVIVLCWFTAACASDDAYSIFKQRLDAGATCGELFDVRKSFDPASADLTRINADLRSVGCYSSSSARSSDLPAEAESSSETPRGEGYTVREYRMYRSLIDTPMSVPEDQAIQAIAQEHRVTADDVRISLRKVEGVLTRNRWFGTPESEIRHASDWNGESP